MGTPAPVRVAVIAIALLATVVLTRVATPVAAAAPNLQEIPSVFGPWIGTPAPPLDPDTARVLAADDYVHRFYQSPRGTIEMDVAYYAQPRVGANMHSPLNCLPGNGWQLTDVQDVGIDTSAGRWPVRDTIVERHGERFALTYWFQSRQRIVGDELSARLHLLGDGLLRHPTDAMLVRLIAPVGAEASAQRATLRTFAARLIPEIRTRLQ